jgi:esterase/lipase
MSDDEIPMIPLYKGHEETYERYCELRDEEWVEKVDRETDVYEFALAFVDSLRYENKYSD